MTSPSSSSSSSSALSALTATLSSLAPASSTDDASPWAPLRLFSTFTARLHLLAAHLARSPAASPALTTALRGVAAELVRARGPLTAYRARSRIYVLIKCEPLCGEVGDRVKGIGGWLALLDDSLDGFPDVQKRAADLARDMQRVDLKVTENEERVYRTLQKEGEVRQSSKAVQSAIIMDLARALGIDPADHDRLAEQIKLLRADLTGPSTPEERRILMSLEKIFDSWAAEPRLADGAEDGDFEDEAHIPPFKNFLCPLTKEVMKDPVVVLESSQTYERSAIRYWFDRCLDDLRDPTCPVTGRALRTLELRPNIGLAGAIEEWVNRNVDLQVKSASDCLSEALSSGQMESVERVLDNVYRISEEHPSSRYRVRNAGIVGLVVKLLTEQSRKIGTQLRCKILMAMHSMAKDEESQQIMLEGGMARLAIRSLNVSSEKEREYALRLLLEFSINEDNCKKIALEKGALVLISTNVENVEHPILSNLAEGILKNIERVDENVQHLAMAGRFQPLVTRLCEGTDDVKMVTATLVGKMSLTSNAKDYVARKGGKILVDMLSSNSEVRVSSLQAVYNLSTLDDNAIVLVDFGVLPTLTNILFSTQQDDSSDLKALAAKTIANIVSNSGHWELSVPDREGHQLQSEFIIHGLLELLSDQSCDFLAAVLHILCGIVSSPQAADLVAAYVRSGNGMVIITRFLEHPDIDHRIYAFRLVSLLSLKLGDVIAEELRASNKILLLKDMLIDVQCSSGEKSEITHILASLPLSNDEVKTVLGPDFLKWTVSTLKEQRSVSPLKTAKNDRTMVDGLLGLLLHYAKSSDPEILALVQENHLMTIFLEQLNIRSHGRAKQQAALGLKYLSESAKAVAMTFLEPQPHGLCGSFVLICGKASMAPVLCPLHAAVCEEDSSFCLLKGSAIKPLVDLLSDKNTKVQIAAVEALYTIMSDIQNLKNAAEELQHLGLFDAAIYLFKEVRPGELQESVIAMVEKFFRVETLVQRYSVDQELVRALVEALKHGTANTKRHAQDALTNLSELSGVGGKNSSSTGRRTSRLS